MLAKPILPQGYLSILEQKRYSINTIRTYTKYFRDFQEYFLGRTLKDIHKDVKGYKEPET